LLKKIVGKRKLKEKEKVCNYTPPENSKREPLQPWVRDWNRFVGVKIRTWGPKGICPIRNVRVYWDVKNPPGGLKQCAT